MPGTRLSLFGGVVPIENATQLLSHRQIRGRAIVGLSEANGTTTTRPPTSVSHEQRSSSIGDLQPQRCVAGRWMLPSFLKRACNTCGYLGRGQGGSSRRDRQRVVVCRGHLYAPQRWRSRHLSTPGGWVRSRATRSPDPQPHRARSPISAADPRGAVGAVATRVGRRRHI